MTTKRGLGREEDHRVAWEESYPHPLVSCMMPGIAMLAIFTIVLLCLHLWESTLPADTRVPSVVGMKKDIAFDALERVGLNAEVIRERESSETVPEDCVISAIPASGQSVKTGRVVRLVLSSGSIYTTIPDVRELDQATANARLKTADLMVSTEEYVNHKTIPFDRVVSILPKPGTRVQKLSAVTLKISKGPKEQAVDSSDYGNTDGGDNVATVKSTVLNITVPSDGDPKGMLRIDISDDNGDRTLYQKQHNAGDKVVQTVQGTGDVTARVYYEDRLLLTRTF